MIIPDLVFNRLKELSITNGVFLLVSNSKQSLREEAPSFAHSLLNYTSRDLALNEKIFMTDTDNISVEMANSFIEFEAKRAVGVPSKILIMHDVELMKANVSDKILKTIEDYNFDSLIILTSSSLEAVSRTIRSRCMIFKEYTDEDDYFITWKSKYLGFIDKIKEGDYLALNDIKGGMQNLGALNVIRALFINCADRQELEIARNALDCYITGSKEEQIYSYLVNSFWCLSKNLRKWGEGVVDSSAGK